MFNFELKIKQNNAWAQLLDQRSKDLQQSLKMHMILPAGAASFPLLSFLIR